MNDRDRTITLSVVNWSDGIVIFAVSVIAVVLFDLAVRIFKSKSRTHAHAFPCFFCKQRTTRRDGYCCDEHRDEDLRTAGFEADAGPAPPLD